MKKKQLNNNNAGVKTFKDAVPHRLVGSRFETRDAMPAQNHAPSEQTLTHKCAHLYMSKFINTYKTQWIIAGPHGLLQNFSAAVHITLFALVFLHSSWWHIITQRSVSSIDSSKRETDRIEIEERGERKRWKKKKNYRTTELSERRI